jgi:glycosyltransferase involved in cell wall biosynthesis
MQADVVLAQYGPNGVHVLPACRQLNLPLVVHFHGNDASQTDVLERYRVEYRRLFEYAAAIIVVSREMQSRLESLGAPAHKLHLNPCGVDVTAFHGSDPASAPPTFLSVGRFTEKKAPHLLLLAFAELHRRHPEARLRMIGDGVLLDACRQLVKSLQLESCATLLGLQPPKVVRSEMLTARCFVQHSVVAPSGDTEGTPVSVNEAGASGLPVVATRHAGIADVVLHEQTGLLVDEYDIKAMAGAMERLLVDPQLAGRLGAAARQRIVENYSFEKTIAKLAEVLETSARRAHG